MVPTWKSTHGAWKSTHGHLSKNVVLLDSKPTNFLVLVLNHPFFRVILSSDKPLVGNQWRIFSNISKLKNNLMIYHNTYLYGQIVCTHIYIYIHVYTYIYTYIYIYMHHASIKTGICLRWPKQIRHTISGFPNGGFPNGKAHHLQQIRDHQTHRGWFHVIPLTISGDVVTTGVMAWAPQDVQIAAGSPWSSSHGGLLLSWGYSHHPSHGWPC